MLVPSDCAAVAVNCWVAPIGRLGSGGVISTLEATTEEKGKPNSIGPPHDIRYNAKVARINPLTIRPLATAWIFSATKFTPAGKKQRLEKAYPFPPWRDGGGGYGGIFIFRQHTFFALYPFFFLLILSSIKKLYGSSKRFTGSSWNRRGS